MFKMFLVVAVLTLAGFGAYTAYDQYHHDVEYTADVVMDRVDLAARALSGERLR